MMMDSKKVSSPYIVWMLVLFVSLFSVKTQAQQFYIEGPTTVNFGEVKSYSLKDSSHSNGYLLGEFEEVWWSGDVMILNNDYGIEKTVNASWDMRIEKDIWLCVSFYESITEEYYYVETFVTVLPPTPSAPTILSSNCNEVVLQRTSPPILTSSSEPSWYVNDVMWYWQSTADGTSTANSDPTITVTSGTQYFLRAKSIADYGEDYGTWSAASSSVSYTIAAPSAPLVGTVTQPTLNTSTGSVVLSGLPSSGTWIINPGGISGTGTSTTVSGLTASNTYNFTVTTSSCTSAPSANVVINAQPSGVVTPTLSLVTQPGCTTSTGSFTITNYDASYIYSANPSTGVVISGATVTAPAGSYVITATSGGSNSAPSVSVTVNVQPTTPTVPSVGAITQPTALISTGSVVLSGLPSIGTWTINPGGVTGTGTSKTLTGLVASTTYNFTVANSSGCVSSASAAVVIDAQPIVCGALSNENYIYTVTPTVETTDVSSLGQNQKIESVTYFDGLGRPMQNIGIRAGGSNKDLITHIAYDAFGRQPKEYLPYIDGESCGAFRIGNVDSFTKGFYNIDKYENTTNPYSEKEFEASPLNRVLKQAAPGNDWKLGSGHEIKMDYQSNTANEVKNFGVSLSFANNTYTPTLTLSTINNGNYNANELYKAVTKDENWISGNDHTIEEFKDKQGKVVLKRTYNNGAHDTYYVYDDYGNLTYVLPPKMEATTASIITINTQLNDLGYQYKYDHRNRLVEKKLPGKGNSNDWEEIVYNKLDQPILTRDPNLKAQNKWLFTKYDAFGRVAYTGLINNNNSSRIDIQSAADGTASQYVTQSSTAITIAGTTIHYNNGAYPIVASIDELHTINYYDNYSFDLNQANATGSYHTPITNAKGLATGNKVRILGTTDWITSVSYYDTKGRTISSYSKNDYLQTTTKVNSKLDFVGKVDETTTEQNKTGQATITIVEKFSYDPQGRLLTQTQKINTQVEELIVSNKYDELGQLKEKGVGGKATSSNRLQTVDYTYNIRGWLKGINDGDTITSAITMGTGDLFGFQINYNDGPTDPLKKLYNGNISQTYWKTTNSIDTNLRNYNYSYDALNRLTAAQYSLSNPDRYNENLTYDKNGNIMSLIRTGNTDAAATTFGTMDNLGYTYLGNRLNTVEDTSGSTEGFKDGSHIHQEYTYDDNGNMKTDTNKGITTIAYNHLNLPTSVSLPGGTINYYYDATGVKQRKIVSGTITNYANGFQYEKIGSNAEALKFFPTAEGYAEYNNANGIFSYIYQYKDHLGNVRLSYKDVGTTTPSLQIVEESSYYPFGLKQKVAGEQIYNSGYKYKYQGQERQDELGLNWDSFKWRNYDIAIGRFMSIDPLAEKYTYNSTYAFQENKMGLGRELEGLELVLTHGTFAQREDKKQFSLSIADYKGGSTWEEMFSQRVALATGWNKNSTYEYTWSGENTAEARTKAGEILANRLMSKDNPFAKDKHATLMGHSHGGNVDKVAKNILEDNGWTVDLINIATPQRDDFQQNKTGNGINLNFYSGGDAVQWFGAADNYMMNDRNNAGPLGARIDPYSYSHEINVADNPFNWFSNSAGHSYHQDYKPQQQMLQIIINAYNQLYGNE